MSLTQTDLSLVHPITFQIVHPNPMPGRVRVAVFDFDGTVSLLRTGWQNVMTEMFVELVPRHPNESANDLQAMVRAMIHRTNGQPTIVQMQEIADTIRARGKSPLTANEYKAQFLKRLHLQVEPRLAAIREGNGNVERWRMPGVHALLEMLRARSVPCYIASGTDEQPVRNETEALELTPYFAGIFGARDDFASSTKTAIIRRLVSEHQLRENELVVFGDAVEEIRVGKERGALAIAVRLNEQTGVMDEEQQARLGAVGADVFVTDFRVVEEIRGYLFGN